MNDKRITEKILLLFSRKPGSDDYPHDTSFSEGVDALHLLYDVFPDFLVEIKNKTILDFGCGKGLQAIALVVKGGKFVVGIDTNPEALQKAITAAEGRGIIKQMKFKEVLEKDDVGKFDIIISQNSMEHFQDPLKALNDMKTALHNNGKIYITFGPPWFAPYGSHMQFFTKIPWVNILFSERTVMKVRGYFRKDGAAKYEEVKSGLNKMSVKKFETIISKCGLKICFKKYQCIKGMNYLNRIPFLRELVINRVSCILCNEG